jgi:hypothetical protein
MIKILGFAPDADPASLGVLTDCTNVVPTTSGIKGAPAPAQVGVDTLAAACRGAALLTALSGARRLIAGTSAALYELTTTTWTDRSRAGAPAYALGTDERWSFVQYADTTLAVTPSAVVQRAPTGSAFANVASSPQAKIIESASGFAVVFNTTSFADEWYCSAYLDPTDWATDVETQCAKGRLVSSPGPITAAKRFGDNIVVYKERSMYMGRYAGPPSVWDWTQVSTDVGCIGPEAIVDTPIGHVFMGVDSLYVFDGTRPRPLDVGLIREWLTLNMAGQYAYKTAMLFDLANSLVWMYYSQSGGSGSLDRCVVFNILKGNYGRANTSIEAVLAYNSGSFTYDSGHPMFSTYDAGTPAIPFDSAFWQVNVVSPAVFDTAHKLNVLAGSCASGSFTTGDVGDDDDMVTCKSLRVRYSLAPTTSIATGYTKEEEGGTITTVSGPATSHEGRHDMRQTARWHRFSVATTGNFTASAFRPEFAKAGAR